MAYRNKSREFHWRGLLKQQSASGLTVAAFCRQESISPHSFYTWRRKFRGRNKPRGKQVRSTKSARSGHNTDGGTQLLPVRIEGASPSPSMRIHLPQQDVFVDVPSGIDGSTVTVVLQALREVASC